MNTIIAKIALSDRLSLQEKTEAILDILCFFNDPKEYKDICNFNPDATTLFEMLDWETSYRGVGFWYKVAQCIGEDV